MSHIFRKLRARYNFPLMLIRAPVSALGSQLLRAWPAAAVDGHVPSPLAAGDGDGDGRIASHRIASHCIASHRTRLAVANHRPSLPSVVHATRSSSLLGVPLRFLVISRLHLYAAWGRVPRFSRAHAIGSSISSAASLNMRAYSADDGRLMASLTVQRPAARLLYSNSGVQPLSRFRFAAPIDFHRYRRRRRRRRVHHISMVHPRPAPMAWLSRAARLSLASFLTRRPGRQRRECTHAFVLYFRMNY